MNSLRHNQKRDTFAEYKLLHGIIGRTQHVTGTLSTFVKDENENEIMTWHALGHWDENIVFGAKIES